MITAGFGGRLGNQLFQYVAARLLAEQLGYELGVDCSYSNTITNTVPKKGNRYEGKIDIVEDLSSGNIFDKKYDKKHYNLVGYWQEAYYYTPHREKIKKYFNEKATNSIIKNDIVMHVRLDDYKIFGKGGTVLNPKYYLDCLKLEKFDRLFIVTQDPSDEYFNVFKKYNPMFINRSEKDDFWFITKFDRIISSNSSFCWWAAFLSHATKIYIPSCWVRNIKGLNNSLQNINNNIQIEATFKDY